MSFGGIQKIPTGNIVLDSLDADIDMNKGKIIEDNPHHYRVSGMLKDISWNVVYTQAAPMIEPFTNINPGIMRWERINWLVKMPRARVDGTIRIAGEKFNIEGTGYSDTNWGEIAPLVSLYEWGQYSENGFSFVFGYIHKLVGFSLGYCYIILDGHVVELKNPKFSIRHTAWTRDISVNMRIPEKTEFIIEGSNVSLTFSAELMHHDILALKISHVLPKSVLLECVVRYRGILTQAGHVVAEFNGVGFYEWSTRSWKRNFSLVF